VLLALVAGIAVSWARHPAEAGATRWYMALAASAASLCLLGCYDDLVDLRARWKLLGQIVSIVPLVLSGHYVENLAVAGYTIHLGPWGAAWTIVWLVLGINALNLIDGMDGLASVIGILTSVNIAVISTSFGLAHVALAAMALAGALLGFVVYNLPPARIYLGDCGSMVIGLLLGVLALEASPEPATANATIIAGALFVPLFDTALAVIRRTIRGQGIMVADRGHIHHRLLDRGFSIWAVLGILGVFCLVSGAAAWLAAVEGQELAAWAVLLIGTAWCVVGRLAGHEEWALVVALFRQGMGAAPFDSRSPSAAAGRSGPPAVANFRAGGDRQATARISAGVGRALVGARRTRPQTPHSARVKKHGFVESLS
jgi:UDP-GlcNAc:undecaprenyl-phosphate GlcNAc-1-phosphate transferase